MTVQESAWLSEPVASAVAAGGTTAELFAALTAADTSGDWLRIQLRTGSAEQLRAASMTATRPVETIEAGGRLSATAARCLRVAETIAEDYGLQPMPPGVLALGLLAAPISALTAHLADTADRVAVVDLIQADVMGVELENLDLRSRWEDAAPVSTTPPISGLGTPAKATRAPGKRRRVGRWVLIVGCLALLVVAAVAGALTAPETDRPGPPAEQVLLADDALAGQFTPQPDQRRTSAPPAGTATQGPTRCDLAVRRWDADGGPQVLSIVVIRCESFLWAANQQVNAERTLRDLASSAVPAGDIPYGLMLSGIEDGETPAYTSVFFRRGQYLVHVRVGTPAGSTDPAQLAATIAHRQWSVTPGTPGAALPIVKGKDALGDIVGPTVILVLLLLAAFQLHARYASRKLVAKSAAPSGTGQPAWVDVSARARDLGRQAQARFWFWTALFGAALAFQRNPIVHAVAGGLCGAQLVLSSKFQPGSHPLWGRHAAPQMTARQRRLATSPWLITVHTMLLFAPLALGIVASLWWMRGIGYVGTDWRFNPVVVADSDWSRPLRLVPAPILAVGAILFTLTVAAVCGLIYKAARRRTAIDIDQLRTIDPRPEILYLRNFADDALMIRTSPLTRRSGVEKLGLDQFEPFEELIVRYLSVYGPVVAVSDPTTPHAPLGAVRESLPMDGWQDSVREKIRTSRLIVVGATPSTSTDGLRWELRTIAELGALDRTILLLAPRPSDQLSEHWRRFRQLAGFPVPGRIETFADRTLAVRRAPTGEWTAVTADRRTDWAYALAMSQLADEILEPAVN